MAQEDKELLLADLCARLPYGVKVQGNFKWGFDGQIMDDMREIVLDIEALEWFMNGIEVRPYLRPMSSMTEEEKKEMHEKLSPKGTAIYKEEGISTPVSHYGDWIPYEYMGRIIDWLNTHHFDYRGLIEKGLALEAPKGMYK